METVVMSLSLLTSDFRLRRCATARPIRAAIAAAFSSARELFRRSGLSFCSQSTVTIMLSTSHKSSRHAAGAFAALLAVLVVQWVSAATAVPTAPLSDAEKIQALIRTVEARKDLQFIRLDVAHSAREAANVLRIKLAFAGDRVKTVDDFIDHVATATQSGKRYYVR